MTRLFLWAWVVLCLVIGALAFLSQPGGIWG